MTTLTTNEAIKKPWLFIFSIGITTSFLSLFAVYYFSTNFADFNIMGWYANYIIPVGAIIVGLCAGSGYGIGAWISQTRFKKNIFIIVLGLQVMVYFTAKYIEYIDFKPTYENGKAVGFFEYYNILVQSMAWKNKDGTTGTALGLWGYAINLVEILGFSLSAMIIPAIMFGMPYCNHCQKYMKTRELLLIPSGIIPRKIKKKDKEGMKKIELEFQEALQRGNDILNELSQHVSACNYSDIQKKINEYKNDKKQIIKLNAKIKINLITCRECHSGYIEPILMLGLGDTIKNEKLPKISLSEEFVKNCEW